VNPVNQKLLFLVFNREQEFLAFSLLLFVFLILTAEKLDWQFRACPGKGFVRFYFSAILRQLDCADVKHYPNQCQSFLCQFDIKIVI